MPLIPHHDPIPVQLDFLTQEEKGRKRMPVNNYSPTIKMSGGEHAHWSVAIAIEDTTGARTVTGKMRLMASSSPLDKLVPGATFWVYEGQHLTARGVVLDG